MSGHSNHARHPGFSQQQVIFDGCAECGARSRDIPLALDHMDPATFARAWRRAAAADRDGLTDAAGAEMPLLEVLAAVQRKLARSGIAACPIPFPA